MLLATLLLSEPHPSEELAMPPLLLLDLARTIDADRRRESRLAAVIRRARSAR